MKEITSIHEIQQLALELLIDFTTLCEKYNLRYSLAYGTLLGAVRHKGFIPWDDDIDLIMPRPDFDKIIKIIKEKTHTNIDILDFYDKNSFYGASILKVFRKDTVLFEYPNKYNLKYGLYIDIFPVDGLPDDYNESRQMLKEHRQLVTLMHWHASSLYKKKGVAKYFSGLTSRLANWIIRREYKLGHKYDFDKAKNVSTLCCWDLEYEILKANDFNHLINLDFEGFKFKCLPCYENLLNRQYGNYMILPPKEERISTHDFKLYML